MAQIPKTLPPPPPPTGPKIDSKKFFNLSAARAGKNMGAQNFDSLLGGGYTKVAEKSQAEKDIAATPQPQINHFKRFA